MLSALALAGCAFSGAKTDPSTDVTTAAERPACAAAPISLDDGWRYYADPRDVGLTEGWSDGPRAGSAPGERAQHVQPATSFAPRTPAGRLVALRFTAPATQEGRSWALRFEQVRRTADVWLNGRKLGSAQ